MFEYHINTNFKTLSEKDFSISFTRFIATILIFLCHFYQYYCDGLTFWFNVAVQMFFFISALLYSNRKIDNPVAFLVKGFNKILVPYYIYVVICCILGRVFIPEDCTWNIVLKLLTLNAEGSYTALNNLWFISHILLCYIMTPLFLKWLDYVETKVMLLQVLLIGATLLGILVFFYEYATYYKPWEMLCYFFGLVYGRMAKNVKSIWIAIMNVFIIAMAIILKIIYLCEYMDYIYAHDLAGLYYQLYKVSHAFLGVAIVIVLVFVYKFVRKRITMQWVEKLLTQSDRYSYYVYITHQIFMLGAFSLCAVFANRMVAFLLCVMGTALATAVLYFLSQKVLSHRRFK